LEVSLTQLLDILKAEGKRIIDEFNLASKQGRGTPQEIADFREHAVQSFVKRAYPQSFVVSKGKITDLDGNQSDSIDCLLLNPAHPHLVDSQGKFRLVFADGCDAAIEVKPDFSRMDEVTRALQQCISVKQVKRSKSSILRKKQGQEHILEHSLHIPFFVFSVVSFKPEKLYSEITDYYRSHATPLEHQIDGICVVDQGIVKNAKHKEINVYGAPPPIGQNTGWYYEHWGDAAPMGFLLNLEYTFSSFPGIAESIMKRVLTHLGKFNVTRLGDGV